MRNELFYHRDDVHGALETHQIKGSGYGCTPQEPQTNGKRIHKDRIGHNRVGDSIELKRDNGTRLPIKIIDVKGELEKDYYDPKEPTEEGSYLRPKNPYAPQKVVYTAIQGEYYVARPSQIETLRAELRNLQATVPYSVAPELTPKNGHTVHVAPLTKTI